MKALWLRTESSIEEKRSPLSPEDAAILIQSGIQVVVEKSNNRIFNDEEYETVGCELVNSQTWMYANPEKTMILGLKPCNPIPEKFIHTHIFFAHAYKNQPNSKELLSAFLYGKGLLYDLEYLLDQNQKRIASFNFYAGYCAAALSLMKWFDFCHGNSIQSPIEAFNSSIELKAFIMKEKNTIRPELLLLGDGQCSVGAIQFFNENEIKFKQLSSEQLKTGLNVKLGFLGDIIINAFQTRKALATPLLSPHHFENTSTKLLVDLICEPFSPYNALPNYDKPTTFKNPMLEIKFPNNTLYCMAIENYASFLAKESSLLFSSALLPTLLALCHENKTIAIEHALRHFAKAIEKLKS